VLDRVLYRGSGLGGLGDGADASQNSLLSAREARPLATANASSLADVLTGIIRPRTFSFSRE